MQIYRLMKDGKQVGEAVELSNGQVVASVPGRASYYHDGSGKGVEHAMESSTFHGLVWRLVWTAEPGPTVPDDVLPWCYDPPGISRETVEKIRGYLKQMRKGPYTKFLILDEEPETCEHGIAEGGWCLACETGAE